MRSRHCPQCARPIADADINESNDVGYCRNCNLSMPIGKLRNSVTPKSAASINSPPLGAWYRDDNHTKTIGASYRQPLKAISKAFEAIPTMAAVLLLIGITLISTLGSMGVRIPDWIPLPIREIAEKSQGCMMILMWVFALAFGWIALSSLGVLALFLAGTLEVSIADGVGSVTTRAFGIGRRLPFDPSRVKGVWVERERYTKRKKTRYRPIVVLDLEDGKPIRFGERLPDDRLEYVVAALNVALVNRPAQTVSASGR